MKTTSQGTVFEIFVFIPFHGQKRLGVFVEKFTDKVTYSESDASFDAWFSNCLLSNGSRVGTCTDFTEGEDYSKYDKAMIYIAKSSLPSTVYKSDADGNYYLNYNKNKEFILSTHIVCYYKGYR